jgi:hypothetical protein
MKANPAMRTLMVTLRGFVNTEPAAEKKSRELPAACRERLKIIGVLNAIPKNLVMDLVYHFSSASGMGRNRLFSIS